MSEQSTDDAVGFGSLPCNAIVYRALLKKQWINEDTGRVKADAYFLREKEKSTGLSVNIAKTCSHQQCVEGFRKCFGVTSLHVGHIRDIGLDVVQDTSAHANIIKLPYVEDNRVETERLAGLLAKQSRIIYKVSAI